MEGNNFGKQFARGLVILILIVLVVLAALSGATYSNIGQLDQQNRMEMSRK